MVAPNNELDSSTPNIRLEARRDLTIGEFVGRDKIVKIIETIYQRALTAAEEAVQARELELQMLAQGVSAVAQSLQHLASRASGPDQRTPYKELVEYDLSDAENFFGRQRAIATLLEKIERGRLAFLHAESGAGKTSLLQAGLAPRLIAAGHLPLYLRAYDLDPALKIKSAFIPELTQAPGLAKASLRGFLKSVCHVLGEDTTLYICLDQFEEFFTHLDVPTRSGFARAMADCRDDPSLNVRWVVALRAEFFSEVDSFHPHIRNPFENQYRLERLTRAEAGEAVTRPAARCNLQFETGLVDAILDDLSKGELSIQPPQLQLVCSELYEALKPGETTITRALYETEGRTEGILGEYLGRVLRRSRDPEQRALAPRLLEALITSDNRRARRTRAELAAELALATSKSLQPDTLDALLSQLVNNRLVRVEEAEAGLTYELVHDYLLGQISLDPAVQARKAAQELLDREAHDYERHGTLLSDDKLAIISPRRSELVLSDKARALIQKSEQALRRQRGFVLGGIGLVIVLIIVGALSVISALSANQQRQFSVSTQQAAETAATGVAVLQATSEAGAVIASTQVTIANDALKRAFERTGLVPTGSSPAALTFDGTYLWVANYGNSTVQAIDPATGTALAPIRVGAAPRALLFDGNRLWVLNEFDNTVQAVNPVTGDVGTPISVGGFAGFSRALAFDGTHLWITHPDDNTVQMINPATGDIGTPISVGSHPVALAFDGQRLWVANRDDDTVQAIDPATDKTGIPIPVGKWPIALAYDGNRLWVANRDDDTVQAIDPTTGKTSAPIPIHFGRFGASLDTLAFDGTRLWVADYRDNFVLAINPSTGDVGMPISVGSHPDALTFDGQRLWVANRDDHTIQAIDPAIGDASLPIRVGSNPYALAFDGARLWVANFGDNTILAIDSVTGDASSPIRVAAHPSALVFDGTRLWVASTIGESPMFFTKVTESGNVQAIDPVTSNIGISIHVGTHPDALIFDGARLWVANGGDDTIQSIDPVTGKTGAPIPVGEWPIALAYDGTRLWVANRGDSTIQSIDPVTGEVSMPIQFRAPVSALIFDETHLWVATWLNNSVQLVDPATGNLGELVSVGFNPTALAFDGTHLWVTDSLYDFVMAIDPVNGKVVKSVPVHGYPNALVFDGTRLWVANTGDDTVQYVLIYK